MTAFKSFLMAVKDVRQHRTEPWTHVKLHPDNLKALYESSDLQGKGIISTCLGYVLECEPALPRDVIRFHSPQCAGAAMVPYQPATVVLGAFP